MQDKLMITLFALLHFAVINCQLNSIKENLRQCYNVSALPGITVANTRPPTSLNVFIELIRRLEDANPTKSPRELSVLILQRLRQDGIMYTGRDVDLKFGIPYMPKRLEAYKCTVFLSSFLTSSPLQLYYGDLTPVEICSLHDMISSTIENRVRGDESLTCTRSARYISRIKRDGETTTPRSKKKDIETVVEAVEGFGTQTVSGSEANEISQCPIERGVVYTNYGAVKGGQVLAGIATGLNPEKVLNIDNRYAGTIAGELAEAAMAQAKDVIDIGAPGGWNSTINPRYLFLQKNMFLQVTDAEIRGSLDGLYMALKMDAWKSTDIKISQILDLYYSPTQRGVLDPSFKSCNRNILYTEMTTTEQLKDQVQKFVVPLEEVAQYTQTISKQAYPIFSNYAVNSFNTYLPRMNTTDLACRPDETAIERVATDLLVFIDANWNFNTLQSVLSYILDQIDVNKFGSRYSIYNAADGLNITNNNTRYLLDFHKQFNYTVYQKLSKGFDYRRVYEIMESILTSKLNNKTYTGGESTIVLMLPRATPNEDQKAFLDDRRENIKLVLPDLYIVVLGSGSSVDYSSILFNTNKDFVALSDTTNENELKTMGHHVVDRIKDVPRAIINPYCGSDFNGETRSFSLTDYVEPKGVNYYRISRHYFYTGDSIRNLKVTENSYGTIDVCISRDQSKPSNQTSECQTFRSQVKTFDLSGYCDNGFQDCQPIYISIRGNKSDVKCKDVLCRFPDNIKYTISLENLGCTSGTIPIISNFAIISILFLFLNF